MIIVSQTWIIDASNGALYRYGAAESRVDREKCVKLGFLAGCVYGGCWDDGGAMFGGGAIVHLLCDYDSYLVRDDAAVL
jgi:hypothetical protein